jgi:hypothetical protein
MSEEAATAEVVHLPATRHFVSTTDVFSDPASFEHAQRVAKVFASSNLVPPHLKGQVADCLIAYQIARRLNEEPLTVFQNIYVVSGRPGWKTEYVIARANKAGVFKNRISWKPSGEGDALAVTASAVLADSGETISVTCDMKMARAENWTKNAKYTSMPEHMLRWRSAAMLIRLYAPEVMLGMPVIEEIETMEPAPMRDISPAMRRSLDDFASGAASTANQVDHDPETGEVTEQSNSAASAATGEKSGDASEAGQAHPSAQETQDPDRASPASNSASSQKDAHPGPSDASGQAAPSTAADPSKAGTEKGAATAAGKTPTNEKEYVEATTIWIVNLTDADAGEARWKSEKTIRNKANVGADARESLQEKLAAKCAEVRDADKS